MSIELIVGPPNSGRADAVLARFRAALERDPVLVVPTADDVAAFEGELAAEAGALLGGSITTFDALTAEIADRLTPGLPPRLGIAQRQALVRAAISRVAPRRLRRSSARPGFAPALDSLIAELQAARIGSEEFRRIATGLEDGGYEVELAELYAAYCALRDSSGRGDAGTVAEAAIAGVQDDPEAWGARPVLVYGFDDLSRVQVELLAALARAAEVVVAVTYADSRALAVRAGLVGLLVEELGAEQPPGLPFDPGYTESATLRHLDRSLFEPDAQRAAPDDGLVLLSSAGARGEAEAIGIELARLLRDGVEPDEIAIVLRHPDSSGPVLAKVLAELGIPVALEASARLAETCVGGSLVALCRAALDERAVGSLIAHLRSDPSLKPGIVDHVEHRARRGEAQTVAAATEHWQSPPRHLARLAEASSASARLRALARSARELAEGAHREQAPLAATRATSEAGVPFSALELRAGVIAADLLDELAGIGTLPGCEQPDLREAIEAIEAASVPLWRGPASGRVRIMSPYRARGARVRALFCASLQDGEFPSAAPSDPLLSEERRREIGNRDLRRTEPAEEERYLFHSCVSRPTERLYLSWQSCDEDGGALARSPFIDEVLDLLGSDAEEEATELTRTRGPELAVLGPEEATGARTLARALALGGWDLDHAPALARLGVSKEDAAATEALFAPLPDPRKVPGPLANPAVVSELGGREVFSAGSLEGWVTCPYRWFVEHELRPRRLEPEADPLWLGAIVHDALERLYRDSPGSDSIPRPGDLDRWQQRFGELLAEAAGAEAPPTPARRAALDRVRVQVEAFLAAEAESESEFRPRPDLLEVAFGPFEDADDTHPALALGDVSLRGRIDRIDVAADGRGAIVRDYKTGKTVAAAAEFADKGTLQIQLYMRAARDVLGLDPVGGLYQPLGAVGGDKRKPRGLLAKEDERLAPIASVRTDRREADEFEHLLAEAESRAVEAAREMRSGSIGRRPLNNECPKFCAFQPICRRERALGAVGDENGNGGRAE